MIRLEAAVTDTHALLYHSAGHGLCPRSLALFKSAEARDAQVYVPMAVIWEVTLLARAGKINLRRTTRAFFTDLFTNPAYQPYDLTTAQVFAADELRFNRDPFDALIVAAAADLALPLISRDAEIAAAGAVKLLW
jgi:PIN domain nuclease of toxin-antitoxin system